MVFVIVVYTILSCKHCNLGVNVKTDISLPLKCTVAQWPYFDLNDALACNPGQNCEIAIF